MINGQAVVTGVERISPAFLRVELGGEELAEFGVEGPTLDQRIKLVFDGVMRTYTVREVRPGPRIVVDFVLHLEPGASGPASRWAATAQVGDTVGILAPRRGTYFGGIEFTPGDADRILLAGDETALPAISAILEQIDRDVVGDAFVEVPSGADILPLDPPPGVEVHWLPRDTAPHGEPLVHAVRQHVAAPVAVAASAAFASDDEIDPNLWETPTYSSSGEDVAPVAGPDAGLYAWIAGESRAVTTIRRHLVREVGLDRRQVAFMGYWREGVAMKG